MGLEGVELIMAYEEAFGVQFTNADAERMRTPRDVIELIAHPRTSCSKPVLASRFTRTNGLAGRCSPAMRSPARRERDVA